MEKRCVIIGASPQDDINYIFLLIKETDYFICADGGYDAASSLGISPDCIVGDGDSYKKDIAGITGIAGIEKITLPAEKDFTDFTVAIDHGLSMGFKDFLLLTCTGGRFDHHFANICMLERLAENNARGVIADSKNHILIHTGGLMIVKNKPGFKYISVAALDSIVCGVTLRGFKYPLTNASLKRSEPIGISNEFAGDEALIEIKKGKALIIYSRD